MDSLQKGFHNQRGRLHAFVRGWDPCKTSTWSGAGRVLLITLQGMNLKTEMTRNRQELSFLNNPAHLQQEVSAPAQEMPIPLG